MASTPILAFVIFIVAFVVSQNAWASKSIPKGTKRLPGPHGRFAKSYCFILFFLLDWVSVVLCDQFFESNLSDGSLPGLPLLGNLLQVPPSHSWLQFKEWADIFGSIYQMNIAGRTHVIVSSEKIANDLLRERGNLYSGREQLPMAAQLLSGNLRPLLLPYNDVWRNGRKLMHALTNSTVAPTYEPAQLLESTRVLYDLCCSPQDYERWFERYAAVSGSKKLL